MLLILASTSVYRRELLSRLGLTFQAIDSHVDETRHDGETSDELVKRLSIEKACSRANEFESALIIGSDQVIVTDNENILGKPGNRENAIAQLIAMSGKSIKLKTGLAVYNTALDKLQYNCVHYDIVMRKLTDSEIENYIDKEKPFDCAGSIKSEGLGISLLSKLSGDDPTAIIGLPLISLTDMLINEGLEIV